ncbi:MAG TPA: 3-octaprenyl-4-hydroxybenzoate carboxy-lyase [Deltaproteobacteria bacterium]|nr:3-octaprenyl-4-hydroxybenzoate carboxy-lyase [Deltaproteobacteria bacterium]
MKKLIVGISGSSAPILGIRLLEVLAKNPEVETHLVMSDTVEQTLAAEAPSWNSDKLRALAGCHYPNRQLNAAIASGSFPIDAMVVIPCSMRSLAAIAAGISDNLLTRAADVTLKERRPLVLVPRETPLHLVHLRNMVTVTEMGGIIVPPMLAFYHQPRQVQDLTDHCVGKVLDVLKISHTLFRRWQGPAS